MYMLLGKSRKASIGRTIRLNCISANQYLRFKFRVGNHLENTNLVYQNEPIV